MRAGFAKEDITPRVGVELCGFGPYLHRYSIAVRDRLWARAMAVAVGEKTLVVVGLDLAGVRHGTTTRVRELIGARTGIPPDCIMLSCTHTHSGPATRPITGWGEMDPPYLEILPHRIARAVTEAVSRMEEATLRYAEVPCEGVGLNREYDRDAPPLEEVLRDDWRPARPELTDTTCRVLRFDRDGRVIGFASHFGCHPVVCCQQNRHIHGDYAGVATNLLEDEHPGSVGLFLQGALGDVNSCVVHKPERESLEALDTIAGRYAGCARRGMEAAEPVAVDSIDASRREIRFSRKPLDADELRGMLHSHEAVFEDADARDADHAVRMSAVQALTLRNLIDRLERGERLDDLTELQVLRLGPLVILGTPFEVFQAIKNDAVTTNDYQGYAPDRTRAAGGYAADQVPMMIGTLPYRDIHDELVEALAALAEGVKP
jgi:hypothetical protein